MKRLFAFVFSVVLLFTTAIAVGCGGGNDGNLSFYAPDGAPALAIAKFINDGEDFGTGKTVDYKVVSSGDIGGVMMQSKGDFIVMPVNAASKLYKSNAENPYLMLAVITHGNLYIMSSDGTNTLDGLKGKVVGVIGQGLVPDLTLKAILSDNGLLSDVVVANDNTPIDGKIALRFFEKATDMIPLLKQGKLTVGLLPEPAATNLTKVANDKTWTITDVQELYDSQLKAYPQAVLMVKKSVYESYKTNIDQMESLFKTNLQWVKSNTGLAVQAVNSKLKEGVSPSLQVATITETVVDNCKIYFENATSAKQSVIDYINKIIAVNPSSAVAITEDFFA